MLMMHTFPRETMLGARAATRELIVLARTYRRGALVARRTQPSLCDELHLDVAACRLGIGTHLVRCLHQDLGVVARQALDLAVKLDGEHELALVSDIEADMPGHARVGQGLLLLARHCAHRGLEARRVSSGEELLGVRPRPSRSAH